MKANIQSPVYPYIFFTLKNCSTKKKDVGMGLCIFAFTFIPALATCLTDLAGRWLKEFVTVQEVVDVVVKEVAASSAR